MNSSKSYTRHIVGSFFQELVFPLPIYKREEVLSTHTYIQEGHLFLYIWCNEISATMMDPEVPEFLCSLYKVKKTTPSIDGTHYDLVRADVLNIKEGQRESNTSLASISSADLHFLEQYICEYEGEEDPIREHLDLLKPIRSYRSLLYSPNKWPEDAFSPDYASGVPDFSKLHVSYLTKILNTLYLAYSPYFEDFSSPKLSLVRTKGTHILKYTYRKEWKSSQDVYCYLVEVAFEFAYQVLSRLQKAFEAQGNSHIISEDIIAFVLFSKEDKTICALWKRFSKIYDRSILLKFLRSDIENRVQEQEEIDDRILLLNRKTKGIFLELGRLMKNRDFYNQTSQPHQQDKAGKGNQDVSLDLDGEEASWHKKIASSKMPERAREKILKEVARMKRMPPNGLEYEGIRNWVEKTLSLPWGNLTSLPNVSPKELRSTLDQNHFGLDKVKDMIVEYLGLSFRKRRLKIEDKESEPIICLLGPPGVGKSTIAKSIAHSLGRKFERIALGGLRDIHDLKGHRKTYLGAVHGAIIDRLISAKTDNPVILLDEIDKISQCSYNISAFMLDILDAAQNTQYRDAFIDLDYDLSQVMFIATANSDNLDAALRNRMHFISIEGYTIKEKISIAEQFLLPKIFQGMGLSQGDLTINSDTITQIISSYTFESGVRDLNRHLYTICSKVALELEACEGKTSKHISSQDLVTYLGPSVTGHLSKNYSDSPAVGVVNGLGTSPVGGGSVLMIESTSLPGKPQVYITGNLGKVMNEAASISHVIARKYIESRWGDTYPTHLSSVYVHYPSAVAKDGPSAGAATCLSLISSLTNLPLRRDFAMTGEINLRGEIMKIGGVKDKVQAAYVAGLKSVLLPEDNREDVEHLPATLVEDLDILFVSNIADIVSYAMKS